MTNEQRIRGADRGVDSAIIVTGYQVDLVTEFATNLCVSSGLAGHGAQEVKFATYSASYTLVSSEIDAYQSIGPYLDVMPRHVAYILSQLEDQEKLVYPWHRVVSGDGNLGTPKRNPNGTTQADRLREEGVLVRGNRITSGFERLLMQAEELPSGLPRQQRPANAPRPKSRPSARAPKR